MYAMCVIGPISILVLEYYMNLVEINSKVSILFTIITIITGLFFIIKICV